MSENKESDRFTIQRQIGTGGFSIVYQAYDRERQGLVALKTLRLANAKALYRFKREFRALANVMHPNLVSLYELISDGDEWFFTMELVDGVDFLAYVRGMHKYQAQSVASALAEATTLGTLAFAQDDSDSSGDSTLSSFDGVEIRERKVGLDIAFDETRLRLALRQVAAGLMALHKAGKLHRDIKPSNVLVTSEGRVVILDFGLVTDLTPEDMSQSSDFVGTPNYMSPEQAAGLNITEASDWYSVGVMLYEALTGRLPFTGKFLEVLKKKQIHEPPAPITHVPGLPVDLNQLCVDLLRTDPQERPAGSEILARLGVETAKPKARSIETISRALVGRDRHLAELMAAYEAMKQGRTVIVYVHGRSGIGKSALMRCFFEELQQRETDTVTLAGRCYEQESVPYKAFDSIVDAFSQYLRRLPAKDAETVMPLDVLALARLFPVLQQVGAVARARRRVLEIPDSQELRRRAFAALREMLTRVADNRPVVLFIDDLQWGDTDSALLLSELVCPPDPPALMLVGAYRSEEAESSPMLTTLLPLLAASRPAIDVRELQVEELAEEEARLLALTLLGDDVDDAQKRAAAIAQESGGSPYFVDELIRYAQSRDRDKAQATTLDDVIGMRVAQLSEEARRLLEILAVAGQPLDRAIAKQAAQLDSDEPAVIAGLRAERLIRTRGGKDQGVIEVYHDRIRETVVSMLSRDKRKAHHYQIAIALELCGRADAERLMVHFYGAGDYERAGEYAVIAADQAMQALAFDQAARLYRFAIEIQPEGEKHYLGRVNTSGVNSFLFNLETTPINVLRVKLGDALTNAGRGAEAAQAYLAAVEGANAAEALELQRRAAEQLLRSGRIDEGLGVFRVVLDKIDMRLAETPRRVLLSLLWSRVQVRLRGLKFRERDISQISPEELIRIDTCWSVARGLGLVDPMRGAYFQARHLLLALKLGEPYRIARALSVEIAYSAGGGGRSHKKTQQLIATAEELAARVNRPEVVGLTTLFTGVAAFLEGNFQTAYELGQRAEEILRERCTGVSHAIGIAHIFSLRAKYYLGDLNEIHTRLPMLMKETQERDDLYTLTGLHTRLSYVTNLMADDAQKALEGLRVAIERWSHQGFLVQHFWALIGMGEAELYRGHGQAAWALVEEQWPALTRSLMLRIQFALIETLYVRGRTALAAAVECHDARLIDEAERAATRLEREQMAWGNALALLLRAGSAATRGHKERAAELLAAAERIFTADGRQLFLLAARRRRGELLKGDAGRALIAESDRILTNQRARRPERFAAMLVPGRFS